MKDHLEFITGILAILMSISSFILGIYFIIIIRKYIFVKTKYYEQKLKNLTNQ
jgi:hypothetical protein